MIRPTVQYEAYEDSEPTVQEHTINREAASDTRVLSRALRIDRDCWPRSTHAANLIKADSAHLAQFDAGA